MNRVSAFLKRHDFFNPRPTLWYLAISVFLVSAVFSVFPPLPLTFSPPVNAGLLSLLVVPVPGLLYALLEFTKVFGGKNSAWPLMRNLIGLCVITLLLNLALRSLNNMVASVGVQITLYPILESGLRVAGAIALEGIGVGAVFIHRKIYFTNEPKIDPAKTPSGQRTIAWYFAVTGIIMIVVSVYLGLFPPVAFEALILLVSGTVLFAVAFPIRWMILGFRSREETRPDN